jgi:hypothetical protein
MNVRKWTLMPVIPVMLVLTVAALAGCKKKQDPGPSCRQIVSYMMRFRELGTFDERAAIEDCRKQKWTAAQRKCMYSAKDLGEIGTCVPTIKIDKTGPRELPMPEWHPKVDQPIETGPQRQQREAEEKAARDAAAAAGSGAAPAPAPAAPAAPAPAAPAPAAPAAPPRPM